MSRYGPCPKCQKTVRLAQLKWHQKNYCEDGREAREAAAQEKREKAREARYRKNQGSPIHPVAKCALPDCNVEFRQWSAGHRACCKKHSMRLRTLENPDFNRRATARISMAPRACAAMGCGLSFEPKSAQQSTCSPACRRVYEREAEIAKDEARRVAAEAKELDPVRRGEAEIVRLAEEAFARLKSPQQLLRLWSICLDVPSLCPPELRGAEHAA